MELNSRTTDNGREMSNLLCCDPLDLMIESWPPQPEGGMMTGKIEPGIKVSQLPTGKFAECTLYRQQHKNRCEALRLLGEQLAT